jgi:hypothetical protein
VCKSAKILTLGKYLFQGYKYGYVTLKCHILGISFSFLLKPLATFEMPYFLESWKLDFAYHSDQSTMFVRHLGTLLVYFISVIYL